MKLCIVPECNRGGQLVRSLCRSHYARWFGSTNPEKLDVVEWAARQAPIASRRPRRVSASATCTVQGCERASYSRGICTAHYYRWRRAGNPPIDGWIESADPYIADVRPRNEDAHPRNEGAGLSTCLVTSCHRLVTSTKPNVVSSKICSSHQSSWGIYKNSSDGSLSLGEWIQEQAVVIGTWPKCQVKRCVRPARYRTGKVKLCVSHCTMWFKQPHGDLTLEEWAQSDLPPLRPYKKRMTSGDNGAKNHGEKEAPKPRECLIQFCSIQTTTYSGLCPKHHGRWKALGKPENINQSDFMSNPTHGPLRRCRFPRCRKVASSLDGRFQASHLCKSHQRAFAKSLHQKDLEDWLQHWARRSLTHRVR